MTTHTPRELRYWDHAKHGPVPKEYWEARAAHAQIMQDEQDRNDRMWARATLAFVLGLTLALVIAYFFGYGPF